MELIATRVVMDLSTGMILDMDLELYDGPMALCGGGPSKAQNNAAQAQADLSGQLGKSMDKAQAFTEAQQAKIDPFATSRLNNGLPFYDNLMDFSGGPSATAYAPAKADLIRRYGAMGEAAPSGSLQQGLSSIDAGRARDFDSSMVGTMLTNEQAKNNAGNQLTGQQQLANPLGYASAAEGANASIMGAPLAKQGIGGILGGLAGGALSKIPF